MAGYTAPGYSSTHPFSELCVEGQRALIIDRWARMIDPACFDLPVHHPLIVGALVGANGESSWQGKWSNAYQPRPGPEPERLLERGFAFGLLLRRRFTPHALKRTVARLQTRVAELEAQLALRDRAPREGVSLHREVT